MFGSSKELKEKSQKVVQQWSVVDTIDGSGVASPPINIDFDRRLLDNINQFGNLQAEKQIPKMNQRTSVTITTANFSCTSCGEPSEPLELIILEEFDWDCPKCSQKFHITRKFR